MGELQAEEASPQWSPSPSSVAHLAGNVAPAGKQPQPRHRATTGNNKHTSQAHSCRKHQRWIQWHYPMHATATKAAHSAVSILTETNNATHARTHPHIHTNKWTHLSVEQHRWHGTAHNVVKDSVLSGLFIYDLLKVHFLKGQLICAQVSSLW